MADRDENNGNDVNARQKPQAAESDQEKEKDESQRDIGLLELAGRAIILLVQDGIGMKKIDESDNGEEKNHVEEEEVSGTRFFHWQAL